MVGFFDGWKYLQFEISLIQMIKILATVLIALVCRSNTLGVSGCVLGFVCEMFFNYCGLHVGYCMVACGLLQCACCIFNVLTIIKGCMQE